MAPGEQADPFSHPVERQVLRWGVTRGVLEAHRMFSFPSVTGSRMTRVGVWENRG